MRPKHDCGEELSLMRVITYNEKRGGSKYGAPVTEKSEWMWCTKCKKPVEVEFVHS